MIYIQDLHRKKDPSYFSKAQSSVVQSVKFTPLLMDFKVQSLVGTKSRYFFKVLKSFFFPFASALLTNISNLFQMLKELHFIRNVCMGTYLYIIHIYKNRYNYTHTCTYTYKHINLGKRVEKNQLETQQPNLVLGVQFFPRICLSLCPPAHQFHTTYRQLHVLLFSPLTLCFQPFP